MPRTARAAPDDLIRVDDVAELLHTTPNAIYVMRARAQRGEGPPAPPAYRVGRRLLFSRAEVLVWLAEHREDAGIRASA